MRISDWSSDVCSSDLLVAGDTLNDLSLYDTGYKGVVVGAAEAALTRATSGRDHVYQAKSPGAGGILEAIRHFPEFRSFDRELESLPLNKPEGEETQLLMVYHRLPYEKREINGQIKRVPPKSPHGKTGRRSGRERVGEYGERW